MFATTITGRPRGALAAAALAVMLAACGGPTASTGVTSAPASEPAPGVSGEPAASAGYSGPPTTIEYAICSLSRRLRSHSYSWSRPVC